LITAFPIFTAHTRIDQSLFIHQPTRHDTARHAN